MPVPTYPRFVFYPRWRPAPEWVQRVIATFSVSRSSLDTSSSTGLKSDEVLQILRPELERAGFQVETGKLRSDKLYRPVFFGENGRPARQYEIDAYSPGDRVALEVEAGRSTLGNAIYRDIIQMSLLVDVDYAAVAVPVAYHYKERGRPTATASFSECTSILDAIYGGRRLELPFAGFLLIGY